MVQTTTLLHSLRSLGFDPLAAELAHIHDPQAIEAEIQAEANFLREMARDISDADLLESLLSQ